jgi:hypothetical protein
MRLVLILVAAFLVATTMPEAVGQTVNLGQCFTTACPIPCPAGSLGISFYQQVLGLFGICVSA